MAKRRGVREKKSLLGVKGAEFFKVFIPNRSSQQLLIPPDFIKDFKATIKEKVTLKNLDGKKWYVDVKETPDGVFFMDGWQTFINHHGLKTGEFLVFQYDGSYSFVVKVFGTNGCKKDTLESKSIATPECVKSETESDEETKPMQTYRKYAAPHNENQPSSFDSTDRRTKHSERLENSEMNEMKKIRNSRWGSWTGYINGDPCFSVEVPKTYLKSGIVCVPLEFWNAHMKEEENKGKRMVSLWVANEEWRVELVMFCDRVVFGKGCRKFLMDNSIKVGNACTFQLIDSNHLAFKVTFRR